MVFESKLENMNLAYLDAGIQAVNLSMDHMEMDDLKSKNGSKIMYI